MCPTISSSRRTFWLTVDWVECRRAAAVVKLPQSLTITTARNRSRSNSGLFDFSLTDMLLFNF
ncbi:hypothetical protein D3C72_2170820 [compost metagenome]